MTVKFSFSDSNGYLLEMTIRNEELSKIQDGFECFLRGCGFVIPYDEEKWTVDAAISLLDEVADSDLVDHSSLANRLENICKKLVEKVVESTDE